MNIKAIDVYRALLEQGSADVTEADDSSRGRSLVDLVNFAASDSASVGTQVVKDSLERMIDPWDEVWVVPEMARSTLEALQAWQTVARAVLERLQNGDETETTRELQRLLTRACQRPGASELQTSY